VSYPHARSASGEGHTQFAVLLGLPQPSDNNLTTEILLSSLSVANYK